MAKAKAANPNPMPKLRPALNPDARENQLISLAVDLVEQRLRDGTASSQETTHFLKLASPKYKLEQERLQLENRHIEAKIKEIEDSKEIKVLYAEALKAMRRYGGYDEEFEEQ